MPALEPDYVVVGGGNARRLDDPPPRVHPGENANAFKGGFRLWQEADGKPTAEAITPQKGALMGWPTGLEPATSGVTIQCST